MTVEPILKPTPKVRERKPLRSRPRPVDAKARDDAFSRDDYLCQWCKVPGGALDPHHRFRRSQGGRDVAFVLVTVHRLCHRAIHTTHLAEAKRRKFLVRSETECLEPWT